MTRRLAFLGPSGTFSEEAALTYRALESPNCELVPKTTVSAVAAAIQSGEVDEGIAAIENSLQGSVAETLDILVHSDTPLMIRNEIVLPIDHYLLARPATRLEDVEVIFAHPQALGQCRGYVEETFPNASMEAALSNSAAVEEAMLRERAAAIGTRRAAELYGAEALASRIQDRSPNVTRFVVLGHEDRPATGRDKTSIAYAYAVEDRPGLLVAGLHEFSSRGINLSKIESRPSKERLGTYIFLVDVDGHRTDAKLAEALERVEAECSFFRILGSYPRYTESGQAGTG